MYYVGIDISKYKHDCFITDETGEVFFEGTISNSIEGFKKLELALSELDDNQEIRIGFESTAHYSSNLKLFLEKAHHSFFEFNPSLLARFLKGQTLRKTKTDKIDAQSIAKFLMVTEYKPHPTGFYHMYSLKSLTRLRDSLVRQRSLYLVKLTNILDHTFPEFKPFFGNRFSKVALHLLEKYHSADAMSRMNKLSYEELRCLSRGHFSSARFFEFRELAKNTVGESNEIFDIQLKAVLTLYNELCSEINIIEEKIVDIITLLNPPTLSIKGVGPLSAAVIVSEFGDISRFKGPQAMLSFAGLEPGYYQSGTSEQRGRMVKRGSSHLRYTLFNVCIPLINYNFVFSEYYDKKRKEGKPHRVALSHVCKKLLRVIYALESKNLEFDSSKLR